MKNKQKTLQKKKELKEQVNILIVSSEDYLAQIRECVKELKKIYRSESATWTAEDIANIEGNFNALKDILVFGELEEEIPALLEKLADYEEN